MLKNRGKKQQTKTKYKKKQKKKQVKRVVIDAEVVIIQLIELIGKAAFLYINAF